MSDSAAAAAWLDRFFASYHRHRPVNATFVGAHEHDARLPDLSEAGVGDARADADALLADAEGLVVGADPTPAGPAGASRELRARSDGAEGARPREARHRSDVLALDLTLARGFLEIQRWEYASRHFQAGNPSLHTGEAVFGVMSLFLGHGGPAKARHEAALRRMEEVPAFLVTARENVRDAPAAWTERAARECRGALAFFGEGVDLLMAAEGVSAGWFRRAADGARRAFAEHLTHLETELALHPREHVAAGEEALALHLRCAHFLDEDAGDLVAYARDALAEAEGRLEAAARAGVAGSPAAALAALADAHPAEERYLARYGEVWEEVRALAEARDLVTWPDLPVRFVPRPAWSRGAAPHLYFLYYRSPAAERRPPVHEHLIAPLDPSMTPSERRAVLRAHHDAAIKLNHVVHHAGLGHHAQNAHAFRSGSRVGRMAGVDCAARIAMGCGGTMTEGWACYATDLYAEHAGLSPLEACAEAHARVRMTARAVVDLELHRGRMTLDEAVAFYRDRAAMDEAAARTEAVKNSMLPAAALIYLVGTDALHRLRRDVAGRLGAAFRLRDFHDAVLSYGSVPVSLMARDVLRRVREGGADGLRPLAVGRPRPGGRADAPTRVPEVESESGMAGGSAP